MTQHLENWIKEETLGIISDIETNLNDKDIINIIEKVMKDTQFVETMNNASAHLLSIINEYMEEKESKKLIYVLIYKEENEIISTKVFTSYNLAFESMKYSYIKSIKEFISECSDLAEVPEHYIDNINATIEYAEGWSEWYINETNIVE